MFRHKQTPGWVGAILVALVVWLWDDKEHILPNIDRETITGWHWRHPYVTFVIWSWLWSHMVRQRPRRVLYII